MAKNEVRLLSLLLTFAIKQNSTLQSFTVIAFVIQKEASVHGG